MIGRSTDTSNTHLVELVRLYGPPGTQQIVKPNRLVSFILVSVRQGAVDIYVGGGAVAGLVPDLHFGQSGRPIEVPIPCGQYEFTIVAAGPRNPVKASVLFGGP